MNQAQLIEAVSGHCGQTKTVVAELLGSLAEIAQGALGKGEEVVLPHLGKLKPVVRSARDGRNPKTGEPIKVPARTAVKFTIAKDLKDSLPKPKGRK